MVTKKKAPSDTAGGGPGPVRAQWTRTELELVAACVAKEPGALEELIARFSEAINGGIAAAIRSTIPAHFSAEHEDLYQEFCLELISRPHAIPGHFPGPEGKLADWLFMVVNHFCLNQLRSNQIRWPGRTVNGPTRLLEAVPDRSGEGLEDDQNIRSLVEKIDEQSRTILQAHYGLPPFDKRFTIAELAHQRGWSISKTYRRWHQALEELHERYRQDVAS